MLVQSSVHHNLIATLRKTVAELLVATPAPRQNVEAKSEDFVAETHKAHGKLRWKVHEVYVLLFKMWEWVKLLYPSWTPESLSKLVPKKYPISFDPRPCHAFGLADFWHQCCSSYRGEQVFFTMTQLSSGWKDKARLISSSCLSWSCQREFGIAGLAWLMLAFKQVASSGTSGEDQTSVTKDLFSFSAERNDILSKEIS